MIADAADVAAPELDPEYPELPEWAWDYCADPSRADDYWEPYCFICHRATDHAGEH
jgi:hypothetical protein